MRCRLRRGLTRIAFAGVLAGLAGCATPVFKDAPAAAATPAEIADQPERYHDADVIWGGKILDVRNRADDTEVEVVAYPLDNVQRPDQNAPTQGRFIVALSGYVEPLDYPPGRFVTLRGRIAGTRVARVDEHDYVFPLVGNATVHLWPVNFPYERPRVSFGVGVGVGIH
jgi:outer membrane lipoprotein